jgi:hypothetical protein
MISNAGFSRPERRASPAATPGRSTIASPFALRGVSADLAVQEGVVVQEGVTAGRTWQPLQSVKRLLRQTESDFVDHGLEGVGHAHSHHGQRRPGRGADPSLRAKRPRGPQDSRPWLGRLAKLSSLERSHLGPIERQHPFGEVRNRHSEHVALAGRHMLDGLIDQGHERGELVRRRPQTRLENPDDPLSE